jgi:hypothetical protein
VRFVVGDGSRVLFWHDVWCGELPLKILFPALFSIACANKAWVGENMDIAHGIIHWNAMFSRPIHDWDMEAVSQFFELLYSQHIRQGGVDKICWIPMKRKNFEVKSCCQVMCNPAPIIGPCKSKAPLRVAFFVWTTVMGKILTLDNLRQKNIIVMEWCCICKNNRESIDCLLLHCEVAIEVWSMVLQLFDILWVMPSWMKECLESGGDKGG